MLTQIKPKSKSNDLLKEAFLTFNLNLETEIEIEEQTETTYIETYNIEVFYQKFDDFMTGQEFPEVLIAKGKSRIFNLESAVDNHECLEFIFDSDQDICDVYTFFYEYGSEYINDDLIGLNPNLSGIRRMNLGFIDRLEIIPEFRGNKFGKVINDKICNWLSNKVGFIALKSFPLQFEEFKHEDNQWIQNMDYESMRLKYENVEKSQKKLDKYYKSLGFKKIKIPEDYFNNQESYFYKVC